jgi:GNAT superfamily N-acetyltransferase
LCALISEWDFNIERAACFFVDSAEKPEGTAKGVFRLAEKGDCGRIREVCKDFFDDESYNFSCLEERIDAGAVFMLEEGEELLGCGIIERGVFCKDCASIGMFTNPVHRKKGVARTILIRLKEWTYKNGLVPVAGCWYYNTLSRKSLESAGMIAASKGFEAILKGKEKLPLRTGNPPGELIE